MGRLMYLGKALAALVTALCAVALAGHETGRWRLDDETRFWVSITGVLIGFFGALTSIARQRAADAGEVQAERLRVLLQPVALRIQDLAGIDIRDLGLSAYLLRQWGLWRWPWEPRLRRVYRVRPKIAAVSHVDWRPGKGVMGASVAQGQDVAEDLAALDEELEGTSLAAWDPGLAYGLTYAEWLDTRGKYGVVLATPILVATSSGSRVAGVLVLDGPGGTFDTIVTEEIRALLASAADQVAANVLGR
jgi:hypothetical protein